MDVVVLPFAGTRLDPAGAGIIVSAMRSWWLILLAGLGLAAQARGDAVDT